MTVETEGTCSLARALAAGRPVDVPIAGAATDSLGVGRVGDLPFAILKPLVTRSIVIDDSAVIAGQRWLWENLRMIAEPGGAVCVAALLSGAYVPAPDERVGLMISGANIDPVRVVV